MAPLPVLYLPPAPIHPPISMCATTLGDLAQMFNGTVGTSFSSASNSTSVLLGHPSTVPHAHFHMPPEMLMAMLALLLTFPSSMADSIKLVIYVRTRFTGACKDEKCGDRKINSGRIRTFRRASRCRPKRTCHKCNCGRDSVVRSSQPSSPDASRRSSRDFDSRPRSTPAPSYVSHINQGRDKDVDDDYDDNDDASTVVSEDEKLHGDEADRKDDEEGQDKAAVASLPSRLPSNRTPRPLSAKCHDRTGGEQPDDSPLDG